MSMLLCSIINIPYIIYMIYMIIHIYYINNICTYICIYIYIYIYIYILVAPCFKNLLRLEAGYPALRCHNLEEAHHPPET